MKKLSIFIALLWLTTATVVFAQRTTDIEGAKDYALVSRFQGSVIQWYQNKNFDRYFMLSLKEKQLQPYEIDGKIERIQYASQPEHSVFEIAKSYENELKKAGFEILLTLDKMNCGINLSETLYIGEFNGLNALTDRASLKPDFREGEFAYLSAKKTIDAKDVYVVAYVTSWDYPLITFDAIEVQKMEEGLVTVKNLSSKLKESGHIAIYDIHFDTGKSEVKPESAASLNTIAEFLKANPGKHYFVVGHTDNVGDFDTNLRLSENRATAVINSLVNQFGVADGQLTAYGIGSLAPIATNETVEGKAKNRRVEIVAQ